MGRILDAIFDGIGSILAGGVVLGILFVALLIGLPGSDSGGKQVESEVQKECEHSWVAATCTDSRTCSLCGLTSGKPLGHRWLDATFYSPRTCTQCGTTSGKSAVVWTDYLNDSFSDDFSYDFDESWHELTFSHIADTAVFMEELHSVCTAVGTYWSNEDVKITVVVDGEDGLLDWVLLCIAAPRSPSGVHIDVHNVLSRQLGNDLDSLYSEMFTDLDN